MFPKEKPKRRRKPRYINLRWLLIAILGFSLPATILMNRRVQSAQLIDMLLIGLMLCCVVYILFQGSLWLLRLHPHTVPDETTIEEA